MDFDQSPFLSATQTVMLFFWRVVADHQESKLAPPNLPKTQRLIWHSGASFTGGFIAHQKKSWPRQKDKELAERKQYVQSRIDQTQKLEVWCGASPD